MYYEMSVLSQVLFVCELFGEFGFNGLGWLESSFYTHYVFYLYFNYSCNTVVKLLIKYTWQMLINWESVGCILIKFVSHLCNVCTFNIQSIVTGCEYIIL